VKRGDSPRYATEPEKILIKKIYGYIYTHKYRTAVTRSWIAAIWRSIPKESFVDSFQKLYERCQQCVVKDGDYFEG
jgi:hypothetical protein